MTAGPGQPGTDTSTADDVDPTAPAQATEADAAQPAPDADAFAAAADHDVAPSEPTEGMTAETAAGVEAEATAEGGSENAEAPRDEVAALTEDLKRVSAEYANYRRRVDRERQSAVAGAKASVLSGLLEIADELGLAAQHGDLEEGSPLRKFNDKFFAVLAAQGVEEFGAEGDDFDPSIHEAVQDLSEGGDPKVATVYRKGYRVGDRTLRNAMVIVGS